MKFSRDPLRTGGVGDPETTDLDRRAQDIVKFGVIEEVDLKREIPAYRVLIGDKNDEDNHIITDWISVPVDRAKGSKRAHFLEAGAKVALLSEGGDLATSRIMPADVLTKDNKPSTRKPDEWKQRFANGAVVGYDPETGELTLDATEATGKITMRGKGAVARVSNGKITLQTGAKADKTGPSNKGKKDDEKPTEQPDADTKFDLNKQLKGLHARVEQLEHTASAQHFATSLLHNLLIPTNPQILSLLSIFNATPGSMEQMIQRVTGLLPGYAQSLLKLALGKFDIPTLDSISGGFEAMIQGQIEGLVSQVAAQALEAAGIERQIGTLTASLAGLEGAAADAVMGQIEGLRANPVFAALGQAKALLSSLQSAAPSAPDFMDSQKNIVKGMIESVRFGGAGKQD